MARAEKISQRLPHFYRQWDPASRVSLLSSAVGKRMDEAEKDLISILQAHWVDKASGHDLNKLGALLSTKRKEGEVDSDYRNRLKIAILKYQGGGTVKAVQTAVRIALKLPEDHPVEILENPKVEHDITYNYKIQAGKCSVDPDEDYLLKPMSVKDVPLDITITVDTENAKLRDPVLKNLDTGDSMVFRNEVSNGDVLKIGSGRAMLNGEDQTSKLFPRFCKLIIPREGSRWQFRDTIGEHQGTFNSSRFDESYFVLDMISSIMFRWIADQPAEFVLSIPRDLLAKAAITEDEMQEILNSVKASGVKALLRVI